MGSFSSFHDPETHVYDDGLEEEEEDDFLPVHDNDVVIQPRRTHAPLKMTEYYMVCSVPPQSAYPAGRLMCSTCSTLLALSISSGIMPDPGSITEAACANMLNRIMSKSSDIQRTHIQNGSGDEMRQIEEVVLLIQNTDTSGMFRTNARVECFGPLLHNTVSGTEMMVAMTATTANNITLSKAPDCIIKGLDQIVVEDVRQGDGIVVTTGAHTTYMFHSKGVPPRWYLFDSLDGTMVCVVGSGADAFHYKYGHHHHRPPCSNGLEGSSMFTGMIMRGCTSLIQPPPSLLQSPPPQLLQSSPPCNTTTDPRLRRAKIMQDATNALNVMQQGTGGGVVHALRISSSDVPKTSRVEFV